MGASLSCARVEEGRLICPWHGLALGPKGFPGWSLYEVHDDGVLTWVRLDDEPDLTARPYLPPRPTRHIDAVIRMEARCDPEDVIANRLDPWHGVHFHPYSFATLRVIEADDERLKLRVAYRVLGPVRIEVDATFHCPDPRTIVMTIVDGEGVGSVVETHATPIEPGRTAILEATLATEPGRTAILEATLATSERAGFAHALRAARFIRPLIRQLAQRLWVDDAAYAERLYDLRTGRAEAPRELKAPRWASRLHRSEKVVVLDGGKSRAG
jgi:isorenieratene synthase